MSGWFTDPENLRCRHSRTALSTIELEDRIVDAEACKSCRAVRLNEKVVRLSSPAAQAFFAASRGAA